MEEIKCYKSEATGPISVVGHKTEVKNVYELLYASVSNPECIALTLVIKVIYEFKPICVVTYQRYDIAANS